jgi:predicted nucleic acid-binding Zn ribbon protein
MSMEEKNTETKTLQIAKDQIVPLIAQLSLVENDLSGLFDIPQASEPAAKAAGDWWQAQKEEDQHTYRGALAAIASPLLIADIGINARNTKLIITHAVIPSLRWNDPIYLLGQDTDKAKFRLEYLKQADLFTNTLLLYLQGAAPVYEMEMKFEVSVRDFTVLLATADLWQRHQFRALLDHAPAPSSMKADDVMVSVTEGFVYPDPRWLLPFSLPVLHISPAAISPESTRRSLDNLAKTGLVKKDGDIITLTEPGERFLESVTGRTSCIRIDTRGVDEKGRRGRQSVLFIRGEHFLWYAGVSGKNADTMVVTTIGLDQAEALLRELFTPIAAPKPGDPIRPAPAPVQDLVKTPDPVQAPAKAPAPAAPPPFQSPPPLQYATPAPTAPVAGSLVCKACGNPIKPGDRFCSKCLVKVPDVPAPAPAPAPAAAATPAPAYQPPPPQYTAPPPVSPVAGSPVCKACGNPIKPGDRFCSKCLVKITDIPVSETVQVPVPAAVAAPPEPAPVTPAAGALTCKACGNPIKPGDRFCSKCLVKVPDIPAPAIVQTPATQPPPQPQQQSPVPASIAPAAGDLVCKACGNPLKPGLMFCSNCGAKIK